MSCDQVTIIIPTYRRPQLLKRALASALGQTHTALEVHVYDNASGDETAEVVRAYMQKDARVKYHCHPHNIGMIANYIFAMGRVSTPYFSLLSDDDELFSWFVEETLQGMAKAPDVAFSAASAVIMTETKRVVRVPLDLWPREGRFAPGEGMVEMISKYPVPTCILFRQKVVSEFPVDEENVLTWDCDFLLQIAARYPIMISKRRSGIFLSHEASYSKAQSFESWVKAYERLADRMCIMDLPSEMMREAATQLLQEGLRMTSREFIVQALLNKNGGEAQRYAAMYRQKYGWTLTAILLSGVSELCRRFAPAFYLLYALRQIKRMRQYIPFLSG